MMLINPYPYEDQALSSFSLIVKNETNNNEIYRSFARSHFIWDSKNTENLKSFSPEEIKRVFIDQKIDKLIESVGTINYNPSDWV